MDDLLVLLEVSNLGKVPRADLALEGPDPCMLPEVVLQVARLLECFIAPINFADIVQIIFSSFFIQDSDDLEPL